jgi:WD40 repeat protein
MDMDLLTTPSRFECSQRSDFTRHRGPVTCVAGIPGRREAITSGYDGAVGLFDLDNGTVQLLGYHDHLVNRVTVDTTGKRAASSSSDYGIYVWDLRRRSLDRVLRGHSDDVEDFAFVNDSIGASVSRDQRILIWDLTSGAIIRCLEEHERDVLSVVAAGSHIYTSGDDMTLRQWAVNSGRMLRKWGPFNHETDTCAIDPVKQRAVLGCDDGVIRLFDTHGEGGAAEILAHSSGIKKVCVSPRNGDILSAAYDQRLRVWDACTLEPKIEMEPLPSVWERSLNWSPDGQFILGGTFDGTVVVWDALSGRLSRCLGEEGEGNACFNEVSANSDGDLVTVSDDGYIRRGRLTLRQAVWADKLAPPSGRVLMNAVTLDAGTQRIAAGAHNQILHLFEISGNRVEPTGHLPLGEGPINCVRVASNPGYEGVFFVACYSGAIAQVSWGGTVQNKFTVHGGAVKALRIHPSEPIGVSCGADGSLASWTLNGERLRSFAGHTAIADDVDVDPSGRMIASAGRDFVLKVHALADGSLLHAVRLGRQSPKCVCFLNEMTVIVGDYWGRLIRVDLGQQSIARSQIARNGISSLCPSGDLLLASSYDGAVYLVRPSDLKVVNTLTAMTQRLQVSGDGD